jgi:hypothetical protein
MTFWQSAVRGILVLGHWQIYIAGLLYTVIAIGPQVVVGRLASRAGDDDGLIGCLSLLLLPVFNVFAIFVFIATISPIVLGLSGNAAWLLPWSLCVGYPLRMSMAVILPVVLSVFASWIPFGSSQPVLTFAIGSWALAFVSAVTLRPALESLVFWPGYVFAIASIVIGVVLSKAVMVLLAAVAARVVRRKNDSLDWLLVVVSVMVSFVPVFMYGAWLGAQLAVTK